MFWILIGLSILGSLLLAKRAYGDCYLDNYNSHLSKAIWTGIRCFALFAVLLIFVTSIACVSTIREFISDERTSPQEIYSLRTSDSIVAGFILGCGEIEGEARYVYYVKNQWGGLQRGSWPVKHATIYERSSEEKPNMRLLSIKSTIPNWIFFKDIAPSHHSYHAEFFVPKGTVVQEFKVN